MRSAHPDVRDAIRKEKEISDQAERGLRLAIEEHKRLFRTEAAAEEEEGETAAASGGEAR